MGSTPPAKGHTGLFHAAFVHPDRAALGGVVARGRAAGIEIDGVADHGVSEAVYLRDPDGSGIAVYCGRPDAAWPWDADGRLAMVNDPLDIDALVAEARGPP